MRIGLSHMLGEQKAKNACSWNAKNAFLFKFGLERTCPWLTHKRSFSWDSMAFRWLSLNFIFGSLNERVISCRCKLKVTRDFKRERRNEKKVSNIEQQQQLDCHNLRRMSSDDRFFFLLLFLRELIHSLVRWHERDLRCAKLAIKAVKLIY